MTNTENPTPKHEAKLPVPSDVVDAALRKAQDTFLYYEKLHRAKPDHEKADRNRNLAIEMIIAIAATPDHAAALARIAELENALRELDTGGSDYLAVRRKIAIISGIPMMAVTFDKHLERITARISELEAKPATVRPEDNCQSCGYRMDACNCGAKPAVTVGLSEDEAVEIMSAGVAKDCFGGVDCVVRDDMRSAYRALLPHLSHGQVGAK